MALVLVRVLSNTLSARVADMPSQHPDAERTEGSQSAGLSSHGDVPTSSPAYPPMLSSVLIQHGVHSGQDILLEGAVVESS